jgi:hypothetical protein
MGTSLIHAFSIFIGGSECPTFMIAPEEHMAPKVPVVTTSTSLKATSTLLLSTSFFISSAVKTWASPFLIFSLISSIVRVFCLGLSFVYLQPMPNRMGHANINTFWDFQQINKSALGERLREGG